MYYTDTRAFALEGIAIIAEKTEFPLKVLNRTCILFSTVY